MPGAIPESVFTKPPSAELRPNQKDSDSLPDYDVLDVILRGYVEENQTPGEIAAGAACRSNWCGRSSTRWTATSISASRPRPGLKVTTKAFGIGRRFPIAQRYFE